MVTHWSTSSVVTDICITSSEVSHILYLSLPWPYELPSLCPLCRRETRFVCMLSSESHGVGNLSAILLRRWMALGEQCFPLLPGMSSEEELESSQDFPCAQRSGLCSRQWHRYRGWVASLAIHCQAPWGLICNNTFLRGEFRKVTLLLFYCTE